MKKSVSRASKISNDAQDSLDNSFPGIPDTKWYELLEKEEIGFFILGLREDIFDKCMDICYENYLAKQAVAFTVHCAYLAWCKVLNMHSMFKDPGDTDDSKVKHSWEPDPEPEPSIIDSWGSECIMPLDPSQQVPKKDKEVFKTASKSISCKTESLESCSFLSEFFDMGEGEYFFYPVSPSLSSGSKSFRQQSIFTRTLSMCRDSLPLVEPLRQSWGGCNSNSFVEKKKAKNEPATESPC